MPILKKKKLAKTARKKVAKKKAIKKVAVVAPVKEIILEKKIEKPTLLPINQVKSILEGIDGWQLTDDHRMIYRDFVLRDFKAAVDLFNGIAVVSRQKDHHPDIHLTQYRNLRIGTTTHELGGLSQNDLDLAMEINHLPFELKHT